LIQNLDAAANLLEEAEEARELNNKVDVVALGEPA
jgi:hypothetical protein